MFGNVKRFITHRILGIMLTILQLLNQPKLLLNTPYTSSQLLNDTTPLANISWPCESPLGVLDTLAEFERISDHATKPRLAMILKMPKYIK